jgi:hypothetical protein
MFMTNAPDSWSRYHGHGLLFSESYLGRRVFDLLRVMQLLVANGAAQPLSLSGRGGGSMIALFAAMMAGPVASLSVGRLSLRNMPTLDPCTHHRRNNPQAGG